MASSNIAGDLNDETIDQLEDLDQALDLLERCNLGHDQIRNVAEVQRVLRLYLHSQVNMEQDDGKSVRSDAYKITAETSTRLIQHLMESNKDVTNKLQNYIKDCCRLIKRLPPEKYKELSETYPAALDTLQDIVNQLESNECVILVAGETGAGKSTLLNLLLGELATDLLPVAHLSSTSAICELKYSQDKKMIVYPIDSKEKTIQLGDDAAETISEFVHQKRDETTKFAYSKVVVYWPCEWLKGGITIVDSPGVGEDTELTEMVKEYLPKAFGFIYVINTPNAGGIDPDRLQDLIFSQLAQQKKAVLGQANPRSAVFVCNKWDNVPAHEREQVKKYVMRQLHKTWPGFVEDQVFCISAKEAIEQLHDGLVLADYCDLLHGLERLIPVGLNNRLCSQYLKVSRIMERYKVILKAHISNWGRDAKQTDVKMEKATAHLQQLAAEPEKLKKRLDEEMTNLTDKSLQKLKDHLLDEKTLEHLCEWSSRDCRPLMTCPTLEILTEKMRARVSKRIKSEINEWDAKSGVFEKNREELLAIFQEEFQSMEAERRNIEQIFAYKKTETDLNVHLTNFAEHQKEEFAGYIEFSDWEKIAIGVSAPLWVPIGVVIGIIVLPFAGYNLFRRQRKETNALDAVKSNIEQQMADLTKTMVGEIINSQDLSHIVGDRMKQLMLVFNRLLEDVPLLIQSDKKLIENVEAHRKEDEKKIGNVYIPLEGEAREIAGYLDNMYFKYFKSYDVEFGDLTYAHEIGMGTWAKVYKATWHRRNKKTSLVAVKEMKESVTVHNASTVVMEEENLRKLQSPNLVKFHGTSIRKDGDNFFPLLVMEFCEKTLKRVIHDNSYKAPGNVQDCTSNEFDKATKIATRYALQIASGLDAIHQYDYLHRDLKCENILINGEGIVKLADFGIAKKGLDITGTIAGTVAYMAPEIWQGMKYTSKADMYSFGMILWEVWYGKCVMHFKGFPSNPFEATEPIPVWKQLIQKCWDKTPEERPTAEDCIIQLNDTK